MLDAAHRGARDDCALELCGEWPPRVLAAWCACACASSPVGGALHAAKKLESGLCAVLDKRACAALLSSPFAPRDDAVTHTWASEAVNDERDAVLDRLQPAKAASNDSYFCIFCQEKI